MVMDRPPFVLELTTKNFVRVCSFSFFFFGVHRASSFVLIVLFLSLYLSGGSFRFLQKDNRIFRVTLMFDGICEVVAEMQLL